MEAKVEEAKAEVGTDTNVVAEAVKEAPELVVHIHRKGTVIMIILIVIFD